MRARTLNFPLTPARTSPPGLVGPDKWKSAFDMCLLLLTCFDQFEVYAVFSIRTSENFLMLSVCLTISGSQYSCFVLGVEFCSCHSYSNKSLQWHIWTNDLPEIKLVHLRLGLMPSFHCKTIPCNSLYYCCCSFVVSVECQPCINPTHC